MALRKQPYPIQFAGGLETKQDPKQVPATRLLLLENATFIRQTTLAKRNGYESLALVDDSGAPIANPVGLATRADELLVFAGGRCYSRRANVDRMSDVGEVSSVVASSRPISRTGTAQAMPDHASNGGVTVVAWEDSRGGVRCSVLDAGGRILVHDAQLDANGQRPRCVAVGSNLHIYWANAVQERIYVAVVNPLLPAAAPVGAILVEDLSSTNPAYDACPTPENADAPAIMTWVTASGWRVGYVHPTGVLGSALTGLPPVATYTDGIDGSIAVSYGDIAGFGEFAIAFTTPGGDTTIRVVDHDDLTSSSVDVVDSHGPAVRIVCSWDDDTGIWWAAEYTGGAGRPDLNYVRAGRMAASVVVVGPSTLRGHALVGRAFLDDGDVYIPVAHAVKFYPYVAIVRLSASSFGARTVAVARLLPGEATGEPSRGHVASVHVVSSRQYAMCLGYRIQLDSENGDQFSEAGAQLVTLDFDADTSYQTAELGRGTYLAGAVMQHYDGARWAESDFHAAPDLAIGAPSMATPSDTGGSMAAGTYAYAACYEDVDAQGELHQGAVMVPFLVTVGGTTDGSVSLAVPTCRLTNRRNVRIGIYRAEAGQTGTIRDIPFYRVSGLDPATQTGANRYVANDPTVDTVTFVDALSDADLLTREPLYANGGIISNDPAPIAGGVIAGGKSRLFWTDPTDPNLVRYSKTIVEDCALEAPTDFAQPVDPYGGPIVAVAVMDDAVYPFKEGAIYVFGGPGPLADPDLDADAQAFTPTALLTADVGCISPGSICQTPVGIAFQSAKGIRMLTRGRQVVDIGAPVDAFKNQRISRAMLLPDRSQIVFLSDDGTTLLYDYERGQWSAYTNHAGYDATVLGGQYHYLRTDGRLFRETIGEYRDDNQHIRMRIETAWIKLAGYLQGWQRILWASFLGAWRSSHELRIRMRFDYEDDWTEPYDLDVDANYDPSLYGEGAYGAGPYGGAGGPNTVYQRRLHINERCQSIQFRLEDVEPTDEYGASFELSELLLTGGVLGPAFLPGDARSD